MCNSYNTTPAAHRSCAVTDASRVHETKIRHVLIIGNANRV